MTGNKISVFLRANFGKMFEANSIVQNVINVSPIMRVFRIKPIDWELPDFQPGQFVALGLPGTHERCSQATEEYPIEDPDKMIKRAYSIASSPKDQVVEFYITLVKSGALTPRLFALNIGDKLWMGKKAVGMFTLGEISEEQNIVMIATGTGLAPYMSMLRSNVLKRTGNIIVIHGAANSWDLGYSSELQLLESMFSNFKYHPTITEPQDEKAPWVGDVRFIQDIWKDNIIEKNWGFKATPENTHIFLCGNPLMIKAMNEILEVDGFKIHKRKEPGQIHIEEF